MQLNINNVTHTLRLRKEVHMGVEHILLEVVHPETGRRLFGGTILGITPKGLTRCDSLLMEGMPKDSRGAIRLNY